MFNIFSQFSPLFTKLHVIQTLDKWILALCARSCVYVLVSAHRLNSNGKENAHNDSFVNRTEDMRRYLNPKSLKTLLHMYLILGVQMN